MAVEVQYVVKHKGVNKLTTCDKKEADRYDKMLDTADQLMAFLTSQGIDVAEQVLEDIGIALAKNQDTVMAILKGKPFVAEAEATK